MALLDDQIDGKYEILEKIREGGMGAIYRVRHRLLDEVRVVKVIRSQAEPSSEASDRFLREARAAIKLRHPNIAVLHDFAVAGDGQAFIVMEFIEGWNLQEVLTGYGPPPLGMTLEIARQSLKALGYLHRHKIVHRDVSPDNLMVTRDVEGHLLVKLIDLGIAKNLEGAGGLTTTGVFLGKPRYGSPERFTGEGWDERSDLYSFGVVLYELLTGRCPILGNDPAALMAGHLFRPPISFDETDRGGRVPPGLRASVLKVLEKKPEERFANAETFGAALGEIQQYCPIELRDVDAVWAVLQPIDLRAGGSANPAGSTQFRLNQEFGVVPTPTRGIFGPAPGRTAAPPIAPPIGPATTRTAAPGPPEPPEPPEINAAAPTQALPASLGPLRLPSEATRKTATPAPDAGVVVQFPALPESVEPIDLDATWARRPLRKEVETRAKVPLPLPSAPPVAGAASRSARRRRPWRVVGWVAGIVALAGGLGAGGWWLGKGQGRSDTPLQPRRVAPGASLTPGFPTALPPAVSPPAASEKPGPSTAASSVPPTKKAKALKEKDLTSKSTASRERRRPVSAGEMGPVFVPPMKVGDLITPDQPAVEGPEVRDLGVPTYPAAARGSGRSVRVRVQVLVDQTGRVINLRVPNPDPSGLGFDDAAREAAGRTTFYPAKREGIPGLMWTEVEFELRDPQSPK